MGTRGTWGFRLNNEDKLFYCQFDTYPTGLGADIVKYITRVVRYTDPEEMKEQVAKLRVVSHDMEPTQEDIARAKAKRTYDSSVSNQSEKDYYCLARGVQGDPDRTVDLGFGYGEKNFVFDSLFCEYGYIINLDTRTLELYKGFNKNPNAPGRYASGNCGDNQGYKGIALVGEIAFDDIPASVDNAPGEWLEETFYNKEEEAA